jgi:hypothetical protein
MGQEKAGEVVWVLASNRVRTCEPDWGLAQGLWETVSNWKTASFGVSSTHYTGKTIYERICSRCNPQPF